MEVKDIKQVIQSKQLVRHNESNYIVTAYILRLIDNEWRHLAELKDLKAKASITSAPIKDIEIIEGKFYGA